tara:strand:- start:104 stop:523 length:420 start_codon:yes stop_codon:yes gene_type:complete
MKSAQKTKGNNGCLQGCGCLTLGFILFALATPRFVNVGASEASVKNVLLVGIKECVVRDAENQTINFTDVQYFAKPPANRRYLIKPSSDNELKDTCFGARAEPIDPTSRTWFELNYKNEVKTKTCGDSSKPGCEEGNKW